ncbi:hypothetical protein Aduo_002849 [Ancylostoma duodenale]
MQLWIVLLYIVQVGSTIQCGAEVGPKQQFQVINVCAQDETGGDGGGGGRNGDGAGGGGAGDGGGGGGGAGGEGGGGAGGGGGGGAGSGGGEEREEVLEEKRKDFEIPAPQLDVCVV